jgi:hypothetical protein
MENGICFYHLLAQVPGVARDQLLLKRHLAQPTPHTPYSAAAVPGIDTIFTFLTIYFEIQNGVTRLCPGHHIEEIKWRMRRKVAR